MSPKLSLWLAFSLVSTTWYVLDPEAGGPFFSATPEAVAIAQAAPAITSRIAGN